MRRIDDEHESDVFIDTTMYSRAIKVHPSLKWL
jgi:hypothetical protein